MVLADDDWTPFASSQDIEQRQVEVSKFGREFELKNENEDKKAVVFRFSPEEKVSIDAEILRQLGMRRLPDEVDVSSLDDGAKLLVAELLTNGELKQFRTSLLQFAQLLHFAHAVRLTHVVRELKKVFFEQLANGGDRDLVQALNLAVRFELDDVQKKLASLVAAKFQSCYSTLDDLPPLIAFVRDYKVVVCVASRCDLDVPSEFNVFSFVLDWLQHHDESRDLPNDALKHCVRVSTMSPTDAESVMRNIPELEFLMLRTDENPPTTCSHVHYVDTRRCSVGVPRLERDEPAILSHGLFEQHDPQVAPVPNGLVAGQQNWARFVPPWLRQGPRTLGQRLLGQMPSGAPGAGRVMFPNTKQKLRGLVGVVRRTLTSRSAAQQDPNGGVFPQFPRSLAGRKTARLHKRRRRRCANCRGLLAEKAPTWDDGRDGDLGKEEEEERKPPQG